MCRSSLRAGLSRQVSPPAPKLRTCANETNKQSFTRMESLSLLLKSSDYKTPNFIKLCRRPPTLEPDSVVYLVQTSFFMDDNTLPVPHRTTESIRDTSRRRYPAHFPDLNLNHIEHAWNVLGRSITQRQNPSRTTIQELILLLGDEWDKIPPKLSSTV